MDEASGSAENFAGLEFSALGSGSSGNASLIRSSKTAVLVDAGLSCRQIVTRLESLNQNAADLDGILITHEHTDHTKALAVFAKRFPDVPVYACKATRRVIGEKVETPIDWKIIQRGTSFTLGELEVSSFAVPHDAVDPVGFVLRKAEVAFGVLTDVGHITTAIRDQLIGVQGLFLEANYDEGLLEADTIRPWGVKQRIAGQHGHLSNEQARDLVMNLAESGLRSVVCGHLSSDCNQPERAIEVLQKGLANIAASISIIVSGRAAPTPLTRIEREECPIPSAASESPLERTDSSLPRVAPDAVQGELFPA